MPPRRPGHPYLAGAPIFCAHRGGAGLAPENTMAAFRSAVERWEVDMIETDVRLTADGVVVVFHDATVDRTTDGIGPIETMTLAEVQELDAADSFRLPDGSNPFRGERVPTFDELLESFPTTRINVEAKSARSAAPLVDVIRRHGAQHRVLVAAEHERNRRGARGYEGPWGASRSQVIPFHLLHRTPFIEWWTPKVDAFQVPDRHRGRAVLTPRFIEEAHRRNIPVHVWTIDAVEDMERLLDWGVDAIQTDRPDRLAEVLHRRTGRPRPPGLQGGEARPDAGLYPPGRSASSRGTGEAEGVR